MHVDPPRQQLEVLLGPILGPRDVLPVDVDLHVLRHVVDLGPDGVGRVAARIAPGAVAEQVEHLRQPVAGRHDPHLVGREPVAEVERRKRERAAAVLLLREAEEVRAVADLRLHFLLAVPEVVVRDQRDHHALGSARGDLERPAVVVQLVLALVGQAEVLLPDPGEMGREDDAAGVAGPAVHVERGVIRRQVRVAGAAEDALDEIQVGNETAGREEPDLEALLRRHLRHGGADERPQQEAHHRLHGALPVGRERQPQQLGRRPERCLEQPEIDRERHAGLVRRDRQPALGDVEDALRRSPVVDGIVQHAVVEPVARDQLVLVAVAIDRETQLPGEAVLVEDEGLGGQADRTGRALELVDVVLDPAIGGAEMVGQQPRLLAIPGKEVPGELEDVPVAGGGGDLDAHGRELEEDGAGGGVAVGEPDAAVGAEAYGVLEVHLTTFHGIRRASTRSTFLSAAMSS